jgi:hypothetical protein
MINNLCFNFIIVNFVIVTLESLCIVNHPCWRAKMLEACQAR